MKLWLVTFELDLTQFLVNAESKQEAIKIANEHNKDLGGIEDYNFDSNKDYINDYTVDDVNFELLAEIIKRNDVIYSTDKAVVFNG